MPFKNSAVVSRTLQTALTGNRWRIQSAVPPSTISQIAGWTGQEELYGPTAQPAIIQVSESGATVSPVLEVVAGSYDTAAGTRPRVVLTGRDTIAFGERNNRMDLIADQVLGFTTSPVIDPIPTVSGYVPMVNGSVNGWTGSLVRSFAASGTWPQIWGGEFSGNTTAAGDCTVNFGPFPNGVGPVLFSNCFSSGIVAVMQRSGQTLGSLTVRFTNTAGAPLAGVNVAFDWLVIGW